MGFDLNSPPSEVSSFVGTPPKGLVALEKRVDTLSNDLRLMVDQVSGMTETVSELGTTVKDLQNTISKFLSVPDCFGRVQPFSPFARGASSSPAFTPTPKRSSASSSSLRSFTLRVAQFPRSMSTLLDSPISRGEGTTPQSRARERVNKGHSAEGASPSTQKLRGARRKISVEKQGPPKVDDLDAAGEPKKRRSKRARNKIARDKEGGDVDAAEKPSKANPKSSTSEERRSTESLMASLKPVVESINAAAAALETEELEKCLAVFTTEEAALVKNVFACKQDDQEVFFPRGYNIHMTVGEMRTLRPGKWLLGPAIDFHLYLLHLEGFDAARKTIFIPSVFQQALQRDDFFVAGNHLSSWLLDMVGCYLPESVDDIEHVCIALNQCDTHWFGVICNVKESKVYIVDSMGRSQARRKIVKDMITSASSIVRGEFPCKMHTPGKWEKIQARLSKVLPTSEWEIIQAKTSRQPNGWDCGMYVIKYFESPDVRNWESICYTTEEMSVERVKIVLKLVRSEHNRARNFWVPRQNAPTMPDTQA